MTGALAKGFQVLEAVSRARGPVRLSALAADLDLGKSTVHRVLGELIELGYVEQDDASGLYRPTLRTWEIGVGVVSDLPIKQAAAGALQQLHERTGETVSLVVRRDDDALFLDKLISPRPLAFSTRVGSRVPLPVAVGGRVILAFSADGDEVVERYEVADGPREYAITGDQVRRAMAQARRQGFTRTSTRSKVRSVAAPIFDRARTPVGALAVSAPPERVDHDRFDQIIDDCVTTATRLSESLGRL